MKTFFKFISTLTLISLFLLSLSGCGPSDPRIAECYEENDSVLSKGTCVMYLALEEEKESAALKVCDEIDSGVRNTCIRNVAVKFENRPLCFENENEIETYICLSNLAEKQKDVDICKEITRKKDEYLCYRQVAVAKRDSAICENVVNNDDFKETCIESVDFVVELEEEIAAEEAAASETEEAAE